MYSKISVIQKLIWVKNIILIAKTSTKIKIFCKRINVKIFIISIMYPDWNILLKKSIFSLLILLSLVCLIEEIIFCNAQKMLKIYWINNFTITGYSFPPPFLFHPKIRGKKKKVNEWPKPILKFFFSDRFDFHPDNDFFCHDDCEWVNDFFLPI